MAATFFELVRAPMAEVEARMRNSPGRYHPELDSAIDHLLSSGGKRLRPTLVLLMAGLLKADTEAAITLAAAVEMLHTATLVHDDLIDGSLLRRGTPTLNAHWTPGATVLTGDYVFARAAHLAAKTGSLALMERFAQTLMVIVNGEINQLFRRPTNDLRQAYFDRIYAKTASLFELAAEGAAMLSGRGPDVVTTARNVGYQIGVAFQIVDDVLDFTGNEEEVGKPVASDLRQGLITLPTLCFLERHPQDPRAKDLRSGRAPDGRLIEDLILSIRSSGAVDQAVEEARGFASAGQQSLTLLPTGPEREALHALTGYIVERTS
jgi:geranylgeranyl pyrophosphate synthase